MKFGFATARSAGPYRHGPMLGFVLLGGAALGALAGIAQAGARATLMTAHSSSVGETIVVDTNGLTVYELRPETVHHLLCTKANGCFAVWKPVTVGSAHAKLTAGHGVPGRLGVLHRNGLLQVTLASHPLYRFAGDGSRKGATSGQDLHSFRGTWHVVAASSASVNSPSTPTTTSTPTTPTTPTTQTTPTVTTPTTPYYPPY